MLLAFIIWRMQDWGRVTPGLKTREALTASACCPTDADLQLAAFSHDYAYLGCVTAACF